MATLIPAIGACVGRMTNGEKRFAWRLEDKLEDDYLCWYDVSIDEKTRHPDFVVFHPSRGLLVLEVKDWKLDTLHSIDKQKAHILVNGALNAVANPRSRPGDVYWQQTVTPAISRKLCDEPTSTLFKKSG